MVADIAVDSVGLERLSAIPVGARQDKREGSHVSLYQVGGGEGGRERGALLSPVMQRR